ncbi:MAG: STAS domain-containing protein [Nannocystaceae bacterium]
MSDGDDTMVVSRRRVERIGEVLSFLSIEAFEDELMAIDPVDDEFGLTEAMVANFAVEHAAAVRELRSVSDERAALIDKLRAAVKLLSTPIIDVWEGVLTLPIVGAVDAERAADMTERLLERIREAGARCVIIDLTGVDEIGAETAAGLIKMIRGAQLLGAYVVVAGIGAAVATELVDLELLDGSDAGFRTLRNLKDALQDCIRHLGRSAAVRARKGGQ